MAAIELQAAGKWQGRFNHYRVRVPVEALIAAGTVAVLLGGWYFIVAQQYFSEVIVPSPYKVWQSFLTIWAEGYKGISLGQHFFESMVRLLSAFVLVVVTAVPIGLLSGYSSKIRAVFDPIIEFYRPLPPLAYYTMLVIWMGIDNESKIALLYLAGFAPVYLSCLSGVKKIRQEYIQGAYTLGASRWQVFRHVVLPACLPEMFTGIRTALGFSYTTLVAAEMVAADSGIGWMVLDASKFLLSDIIFTGIIIMGITGLAMDALLRVAEHRLVPWKGKD